MKRLLTVLSIICLGLTATTAMADRDHHDESDQQACPVGLFAKDANGNLMTIDDEFGAGSNAITRCLANRNKIKLVMQVNKACRDTAVVSDGNGGYRIKNHPTSCNPGRGYGVAQMKAMIRDFTVTNGIPPRKLDLVMIFHDGGGYLLLKGNAFEQDVKDLLAAGVRMYFCQNTVRGFIRNGALPAGDATSHIIEGVEYVTGGLTALSDFEGRGYTYIQP